jgi:hypothetical protein
MSAQLSDVPGALSGSHLDPAAQREVVRRATQLCLRAEPHTDQSPCVSHLSEANRQLMGLVV